MLRKKEEQEKKSRWITAPLCRLWFPRPSLLLFSRSRKRHSWKESSWVELILTGFQNSFFNYCPASLTWSFNIHANKIETWRALKSSTAKQLLRCFLSSCYTLLPTYGKPPITHLSPAKSSSAVKHNLDFVITSGDDYQWKNKLVFISCRKMFIYPEQVKKKVQSKKIFSPTWAPDVLEHNHKGTKIHILMGPMSVGPLEQLQ